MIKLCDTFKNELNNSIQLMTEGAVDKGTKLQPMLAWLAQKGIELDSLDASSIETTLCRPDLPEDVRALLEHRQLYSKSSVSKYEAAMKHAQNDNKIRGMFLFHGAHTGRWSGKGVQLQNLPSRGQNAGKLKSAIRAPKDHVIIDADSSQIEARVLAWLAGQDDLSDAFEKGEDVYKIMASAIYAKEVEEISKEERFVGKTTILGAGYGMGAVKFQAQLKVLGASVEEMEAKRIIEVYRTTYPKISDLWKEAQKALDSIRQNTTTSLGVRPEAVSVHGSDGLKLPSGLFLRYPELAYSIEDGYSY
jgi:DNA polymerase